MNVTQTHMKLQSEFSREFKKKTIFARLPPLASAARGGPHPLATPLLTSNFRVLPLERTECRKTVTICNKLKMIFADRKLLQHLLFFADFVIVLNIGPIV